MRNLVASVLLCFLFACSSETDNSDPPAPLTKIDNRLVLDINWKADTRASSNRASYRLRPLLLGDRVYTIDTGGLIRSINVVSGRRIWKVESGLQAITGLGGKDDFLVATSQDGEIATFRILEDGLEPLWSIRVDSEIRVSAVIDGGQIFVRSVDGKLRSLSAADGSEQWQVSHRVPVLSLTGNSGPLVAGELVFSGFDDGKLIAYERNSGKTRWETTVSLPSGRTEVERLVDLDGRFALRDGVIYISSFQGKLAAVQAVSGDVLWSREFSSSQSIAVDDNALYLTADGSDLWAIDRRTGSALWKQDVLHARKITAPSLIGDELVVADFSGYLHWFSKQDGRLFGRIRTTSERNYVQPVIWGASVITLDKSGFLTSVQLVK
jgi:outer membrane protein assembly factor BamB